MILKCLQLELCIIDENNGNCWIKPIFEISDRIMKNSGKNLKYGSCKYGQETGIFYLQQK